MSDPPRVGRSSREDAEASRYFYPDSSVLINKLGLTDQADLDRAEALLVADRLASLDRQPITTYAAFKAAHAHIFGDLYDWAGQERTYTTGRDAAPFAVPEYIAPEMEKRFALIRADQRLTSRDAEIFAAAAAEHAGEINAIHPFLEGNGRMTRLFVQGHAEHSGHAFSSAEIARGDWYAAAARSFAASDYGPLAAIIETELRRRAAHGDGGHADGA